MITRPESQGDGAAEKSATEKGTADTSAAHERAIACASLDLASEQDLEARAATLARDPAAQRALREERSFDALLQRALAPAAFVDAVRAARAKTASAQTFRLRLVAARRRVQRRQWLIAAALLMIAIGAGIAVLHQQTTAPTMPAQVAHPGDLNRDSQVNADDLAVVLAHFGQSRSSALWAPDADAADTNSDGQINADDLLPVLAHFGMTWRNP